MVLNGLRTHHDLITICIITASPIHHNHFLYLHHQYHNHKQQGLQAWDTCHCDDFGLLLGRIPSTCMYDSILWLHPDTPVAVWSGVLADVNSPISYTALYQTIKHKPLNVVQVQIREADPHRPLRTKQVRVGAHITDFDSLLHQTARLTEDGD